MTKSEKDLMDAFAGESQANRKYLAFAKAADKEGFPQIARVFRAAAAAETVHAHNHLRAAGGIKKTIENVKESMAGKQYEHKSMYPPMLAHAQEEGNKKAETSFHYALEVEKIHDKFYQKALASVEGGKDLKEQKMFVCPVCGFTVEGEVPEKCPVCNASGSTFMAIE